MTQTTSEPTRSQTRRFTQLLPLALGLLPGACFIDTDNPCRENEVFDETGMVCACEKGYGMTPDGCVKCGKHEVPDATGCVCEEGYAKSGTDTACTKVEAPPPAASSGDLAGADGGAESAEPTGGGTNKLSAEGEGTACTGDEECSAFPDAKSCDAFVMACSIKNCTIDPNNCPDEYVCCDVSAFAPGAPNVCIKGGCPTF